MEYDDRPEPAKRLEQARVAKKFKTMKDAANFHGWSYETYQQHEKGTRGIGRAAEKYARAYDVSAGWLLTGEGSGPGDRRSLDEMVKDAPEETRDAIYDFVKRLTQKAS